MISKSINAITRLQEGAYNPSTGRLKIKVIKAGFNKGRSRFYPESTLARDFGVFEGAKMFGDHQTDAEVKARPEGSVHDWVGQITNVAWDSASKSIVAEAAVIDPPFKAKLEELNRQGLLSQMGISIRASGSCVPDKISGHQTQLVESLTHARSVDFVTYPGAGGQVEAIEAIESAGDVARAFEELGYSREEAIEAARGIVPEADEIFDSLYESARRSGMTHQESMWFASGK